MSDAASRRLHVSVPLHDIERLRQLDPEGGITHRRLGEALADMGAERCARIEAVSLTVHDRVPAEALARLPALRVLVTRSTGFDHLPLDTLRARGVRVYHLGDYAAEEVADHALTMALALLRRVPEAMATTRGPPGSWDRSSLVGRGLRDVVVGVLGTGTIGAAFARKVIALGGRVVGHDIVRDPDLAGLPRFRYVDPLESFLAQADLLSIHLPLVHEGPHATERLLDATALDALPDEALLVNTARGDVLDTEAVVDALRRGRLAGFAADVLPGEPTPPHLRLFAGMDKVILTPHLGAYDQAAVDERYHRTVRILDAVLDAGDPQDVQAWRLV